MKTVFICCSLINFSLKATHHADTRTSCISYLMMGIQNGDNPGSQVVLLEMVSILVCVMILIYFAILSKLLWCFSFLARNTWPVTVHSNGQKIVKKETSELSKNRQGITNEIKGTGGWSLLNFWVMFRSVFWKKYLSRIHAGKDILFTTNDALWYRTVIKL